MVAPWAAAASPTQLDPSFNGDGLVTLHPVTGDSVLADMAVLKHGKTMVLVLTRDDPAFELHRLRQNGTPDPVFGGGDGVFAFGPAADYDDVHLAVDPHSGKAYVSAVLDDGTTQVTTVWRIENNGTSD